MINLWVFICTIFISVLSVNAQNILTNAGFESDFTNWEERVANTDYAANFNISTSEIHSGSKAAHVEVTKVASDYWAFKYHNIRLKQQGFSVQDADVLRLSFWAKYAGSDLHPMIQAGVAKNATENTDFWE